MFKSDGAPVLIDFDSCAHVGENLVKVGGREDQYYTHATPMNDYTGLKKIEDIINSQCSDAKAKSQRVKNWYLLKTHALKCVPLDPVNARVEEVRLNGEIYY